MVGRDARFGGHSLTRSFIIQMAGPGTQLAAMAALVARCSDVQQGVVASVVVIGCRCKGGSGMHGRAVCSQREQVCLS